MSLELIIIKTPLGFISFLDMKLKSTEYQGIVINNTDYFLWTVLIPSRDIESGCRMPDSFIFIMLESYLRN